MVVQNAGVLKLFLRIPDMVKNKYMSSHGKVIAILEEKLKANKNISRALAGVAQDTTEATTTAPPTGSTSRTLATPDFEGCVVPNFETKVQLDPKPLDEFIAGRTCLGSII